MLDTLQNTPWLFWLAVLVFSLLFGSFLNVVIVRLPRMMEAQFRTECEAFLNRQTTSAVEQVYNLAFPGSQCVACEAKIKFYDNIPLFSFLLLKGKCRQCGHKISWRYPLVEALTALIGLWSAWHFGLSISLIVCFAFALILLVLTFIDLEHMLLPDTVVYLGLWGALLGSVVLPQHFTPTPNAIWGAVIGYLTLWSIFWLFKLLTGKEGLGQGDFKLLAMLGAWCGVQQLPAIIFIASTLGAIVGISLILFGRINREQPIPFGPYLAFAGWITYLYGSDIQQWYWQLVWT